MKKTISVNNNGEFNISFPPESISIIPKNIDFSGLEDVLIKEEAKYNIVFNFSREERSYLATDVSKNDGTYILEIYSVPIISDYKNIFSDIGKELYWSLNE